MTTEHSPQFNLESLRKEARRWLNELRSNDPSAIARLTRVYPHSKTIVLRSVQHALALEQGFSSWAALKQECEDRTLAARSHSERVLLFLQKSANRYGVAPGSSTWNTGEPDAPARGELAARLLARHPEIVRDSIHTAVAAHDLKAVAEYLAKDSTLANQPARLDSWTPLLRLAYTRIPIVALAENAVSIATMLLDHGADPKAAWSDGENQFTVLTGVIGGGEGQQAARAHPQAEALARLLIARGAEPFDLQGLYNTSLGADSTQWLELLWSASNARGEAGKWTAPRGSDGKQLSKMDYLLGNAVPNHPHRVAWLLEHGANASTVNSYSKQPVIKHAVVAGRQDIVDLLVRHGAQKPTLSDPESFVAAALQGDAATLKGLASRNPLLLKNPHALFAAIPQDREDIARILLDLGTSPNVSDAMGFSALHSTTHCGAPRTAKLLIERGATVDAIERRYNSTPLGHAHYQGRRDLVDIIAPHSRDIRGLCFGGCIDRLSELLGEDPSLARTHSRGEAPLFALPDDDEGAAEVAELLLAHGADPTAKNQAGLTPAEAARKRGLEDAAAVLSAAETGS